MSDLLCFPHCTNWSMFSRISLPIYFLTYIERNVAGNNIATFPNSVLCVWTLLGEYFNNLINTKDLPKGGCVAIPFHTVLVKVGRFIWRRILPKTRFFENNLDKCRHKPCSKSSMAGTNQEENTGETLRFDTLKYNPKQIWSNICVPKPQAAKTNQLSNVQI